MILLENFYYRLPLEHTPMFAYISILRISSCMLQLLGIIIVYGVKLGYN